MIQPMAADEPREPKLLDRVREATRVRHLSPKTEKTYIHWIRRYILFHDKRHPQEMGETGINAFLTHFAVVGRVSASTQTQALCAILFLYRAVLKREVGELEGLIRARRKRKLPVVLTPEEVKGILAHTQGVERLFLFLLYGTGMRIAEIQRLRVKDVDFSFDQITVRDGKGEKDRVTMLPASLKMDLVEHLKVVKRLHECDLKAGQGRVHLPYALARKYANAAAEWGWQWVFPAPSLWYGTIRVPGNEVAITCTRDPSNEPSTTPLGRPASPSTRPATPSAIASRPTSSTAVMTSGPSRSSSGTGASRPP
jgi:integron integrase